MKIRNSKVKRKFRIEMFAVSMVLLVGGCVCRDGTHPNFKIVRGDLGASADRYFSRLAPFGLSGSFLFAQGDSIVYSSAFGYADRENRILNTPSTIFSIGSLTKQFTAAAILKLESKDLLSTEDSIGKFFISAPPEQSKITVHQLLTHTSGLPLYVNESNDFIRTEKNEMFEILWNIPSSFEPGEDFLYSNTGYSILAAIIEEVTKESYEEYIREQFFDPVEMHATGYELANWQGLTEASNYIDVKDYGTFRSRDFVNWNLMGNGAMLSTTEDLFKWYRALRDSSILSNAQKKKLFTPFLEDYAYGWEVYDDGNIIEHSGGGQGNNSLILWYPEKDAIFIGLSNYSFDGLDMIDYFYDDLELLIFDKEVSLAPKIERSTKSKKELTEGLYICSNDSFEVRNMGNRYRISTYSQGAINLLRGDELEKYRTYNELATRLFSNVLETQSYDLLDSLINDSARRKRISRAIQGYLDDYGFENPTALPFRTEYFNGRLRTFVVITESGSDPKEFEDHFFLSIVWEENEFYGIGRTIMPFAPVVYYFISERDSTFVGYNMSSHEPSSMIISSKEEPELIINGITAALTE